MFKRISKRERKTGKIEQKTCPLVIWWDFGFSRIEYLVFFINNNKNRGPPESMAVLLPTSHQEKECQEKSRREQEKSRKEPGPDGGNFPCAVCY